MYTGGRPSDRVAAPRCNLSSHLWVLLVYACCSYDVITTSREPSGNGTGMSRSFASNGRCRPRSGPCSPRSQWGCAVLLIFFILESRFPRDGREVPQASKSHEHGRTFLRARLDMPPDPPNHLLPGSVLSKERCLKLGFIEEGIRLFLNGHGIENIPKIPLSDFEPLWYLVRSVAPKTP
jgi:hypothetical protein